MAAKRAAKAAKAAKAITVKQRKISDRSLANLKPFDPGRSGNPEGRPKRLSFAELIRAELDKADRSGKTKAEKLVETLVRDAVAGSFAKAKEILDRLDGKVADRIAGPEGEPLGPNVIIYLPANDRSEAEGDPPPVGPADAVLE